MVRDTDNLSIVVHNSNAPPFTDPLHPVCGNDCIWGNNKVSVKYPDGTIKIMSFKKFYQKYQINSDLKLIGIRSNEVILEDILRKDYSGDIISFKVGEVETKLTADHLVELFNGEFIPARSIRDGLIINTGIGPQLVQNTRVYTVHDTVTVFEPVTTKSYILEEKGPSLKNSAQEIGGVEGGVTSQQTPSQPNEAQQLLNQRRILMDQDELKRLAIRCGYIIENKGRREGILIRNNEGEVLTVIPHAPGRGLSKGIMKELATGVRTFRR